MLHPLLKSRLGFAGLLFLAALWLGRPSLRVNAQSIFDGDKPPAAGSPSTKPSADQPPLVPLPPVTTPPQTQPVSSAVPGPTLQPQTQPAQTRPSPPQRALYQLPQLIPSEMEFRLAEPVVARRFPMPTTMRSGSGQSASAATLMEVASAEEGMAMKFLLLKRAREAYLAGGDPADALWVVHEMAWNFDVDGYGLSQSVLETASRMELAAAASREVVKGGLHCALLALRDDQFESASKLAAIAEVLARRAKDPGMLTLAHQLVLQLQGLPEDSARVKEARQRLAKTPADPADNLLVGRFLCLTCRQWSRGLPLLARGADPALRDLARQELNPPTDGDAQSDLADRWNALGRSMDPGRDRDSVLDRAAEWYEAAQAQLTSSAAQTAGKRAAWAWADRMQHGLVAEIYSGSNFAYRRLTRLDQNIDWSWPASGPEPDMGHADFSICWRGCLSPPRSGVYRIVAKADSAIRVFIGGKLLIDARVDSTVAARTADVTFGVEPEDLRVEYHQARGAAYAGLGWIPPKQRGVRAIPASALLHAPVELAELFPPPLSADDSGTVWLDAGAAELRGHAVNLSDHGAGPQLYDWPGAGESPSWEFTAPPGDYAVEMVYSAADHSDAHYTVCINGAKLAGAVAGGSDALQSTMIDKVHLLGGNVTLTLKPDSAATGQIMSLQRIELVPIP